MPKPVDRFISTSKLGEILGISRVQVFRLIKTNKIKAKKIGRNFVIDTNDLPEILGNVLSEKDKKEIIEAVQRIVTEYGETLRLLGKE